MGKGRQPNGQTKKVGFGTVSTRASVNPMRGSLLLGQPFTVVPNWGERMRPFCHVVIPLAEGNDYRGMAGEYNSIPSS